MEERLLLSVESKEELSVRRFSIHEGLSQLFEVDLIVLSHNDDVDLEAIVGKAATFRIKTGLINLSSPVRQWTGVVRNIEQVQAEHKGLSTYHVILAPQLWLLTQRRGNRIFQHKKIPEIVQKVLSEWGITPTLHLKEEYNKLEYVAQYAETDYNFVCRLLERAGITFSFVFHEGHTELVLDDHPEKAEPRGGPAVRYVDNPNQEAEREFVTMVQLYHQVRPGKFTYKDFDFRRKPDYDLKGEAKGEIASEQLYEQYHYEPGGFLEETGRGAGGTPVADDKGMARHDDQVGKGRAERSLRSARRPKRVVSFATNCVDLTAGAVFSIDHHPRKDLGPDKKLLITEFSLGGTHDGKWHYAGAAVFDDLPYQPEHLTPRPRVHGLQSAVVVGPAGEEIHVDEFGRVRVQFHWDREGKYDDNSSCWVRVSQNWAGVGYGSIMIPRVGQEVLVGYLEGDPDQPVIMGRVYNATTRVPYKLPDFKTRSTWKSDSSPNSKGFNEIMFEDLKAKELFYVQAQLDLQKLVKELEVERAFKNKVTIVGNNLSDVISKVDSIMVGDRHVLEMIKTPSPDDLKILPQDAPSVSPLPTKVDMIDERIIFTTGEASVVLEHGNMTFEANGTISVKAKGGDLAIEAKPVYINTKTPPAAPKPSSVPKIDPLMFHEKPVDDHQKLSQQVKIDQASAPVITAPALPPPAPPKPPPNSGGGGANTPPPPPAPPKAGGPGTSSGPPSDECTQEGHPVDVASGNVVDRETDLTIPGIIPVVWKREYSSARRLDATSALGPGWAHAYDEWIVDEGDVTTLRAGDGREIRFASVRPGGSSFHRRERMRLGREPDGSYSVYSLTTRQTRLYAGDGRRALLRAIRDPYGNTVRFEYAGDKLSRILDTAGREVRVEWQSARVVRLEVIAAGQLEQWVDYTYSLGGALLAAIDALGHADRYEYDTHGRMISASLKNGVRFSYEYDPETGWCSRTYGPAGLHGVDLVADRVKHTTLIDSDVPKLFTWNDQGLVIKETTPDGALVSEKLYDDDALLIGETNGAGEGKRYFHDEHGNRVRTVDAAGFEERWEYDRDRPVRAVSPDGTVTTFVNDEKGQLTAITFPTGLCYALAYDERGRLASIAGPLGVLNAYEYDDQNNLRAEIDARGARTSYTYDALGRPLTRTDALGRTTAVTYDRLGRPVSVKRPDGTVTHSEYDELGNLVRATDADGRVTTMEYAGTGVIRRIGLPGGGEWKFTYSSGERLQRIENPKGEIYEFSHDARGRIAVEKTFDGRALGYRYSPAGRIAQIDYPDNTFRAFDYDSRGLITGERSPDAEIAYQRDRFGRLLGAEIDEKSGKVVTRFERDEIGKILAEAQGDLRVRFGYDDLGRLTSRTMPDGQTTRYTYDALGDLSAVEHAGRRIDIDRDVLGREIRTRDAGGRFSIEQGYDAMDRLLEQRATAPAPGSGVPTLVAERRWHYDAVGRLVRLDDRRWGDTLYRYDGAGNLAEAGRGAHREIFEHDAAGSILDTLSRLEGPKESEEKWDVRPGNVLARTRDAKYTYDARARRVAKLALSKDGARGEGLTEYAWDCRDRLREVKLPAGRRLSYTYDAFGRRVEKHVFEPGAAAPKTVRYVWDGDVLAADLDPDRGARTFVHEPGTFYPLMQIERGKAFTYVNDHLGTPRELLDEDGRVAWAASGSAFGDLAQTFADAEAEAARGFRVETPFRLLGQYADEETGLRFTQNRLFDPDVGRWLSPDPLGFWGGSNLFGFGPPTSATDPLGLASFLQIGTMESLTGAANVGDGYDAHELLQAAWLDHNNVSHSRYAGIGKDNPAIALPTNRKPGIHQTVGQMQEAQGLFDEKKLKGMKAQENIDLNAKILLKAMIQEGVAPNVAKKKVADLKKKAEAFVAANVPKCKR
jgi:type VI secretion system VgrG family protein